METSELVGFLEAFKGSMSDDNKNLYKKIIESSEISGFTGYEEFYFAIIYPFDNFIDGFVQSEISDNEDVIFLMRNSQFIENNFQELIVNKEGSACCADKSRTIIKRLIEFYITGEKIEFDYEAKYTYHLPKTIFKSHDHIVSFYKGLQGLFYGKNEKYLQSLRLVLAI